VRHRPGAAVGQPPRAGERGPEVIGTALGIPGPFLTRAPATLAGPPALLLGLPAVALFRAAALLIRPAAPLLGCRPLRVLRFAISIRHSAFRSRWSY
jgi:hypothetical protein